MVALDADTGALKWHFQFTPNDGYDYDSVQVPVLVECELAGPAGEADAVGEPQRLLLRARSRDRQVPARAAVRQGELGQRPRRERAARSQTPQPPGTPTFPGNQGGTNWYSPSYSPRTGLFYFSAWENYASIYREGPDYQPGRNFAGGGFTVLTPVPGAPQSASAAEADQQLDRRSRQRRRASRSIRRPASRSGSSDISTSPIAGILTTASDLLFTGGREGYFYALDARTGELLWKASLGGQIAMAPSHFRSTGSSMSRSSQDTRW